MNEVWLDKLGVPIIIAITDYYKIYEQLLVLNLWKFIQIYEFVI